MRVTLVGCAMKSRRGWLLTIPANHTRTDTHEYHNRSELKTNDIRLFQLGNNLRYLIVQFEAELHCKTFLENNKREKGLCICNV